LPRRRSTRQARFCHRQRFPPFPPSGSATGGKGGKRGWGGVRSRQARRSRIRLALGDTFPNPIKSVGGWLSRLEALSGCGSSRLTQSEPLFFARPTRTRLTRVARRRSRSPSSAGGRSRGRGRVALATCSQKSSLAGLLRVSRSSSIPLVWQRWSVATLVEVSHVLPEPRAPKAATSLSVQARDT
jgi:hypothetical protein